MNTVFYSWEETGFAWEQYNPDTGKGQRTQHFTGWIALIAKIMAMPDLRPVPTSKQIDHPVLTDRWNIRSISMTMSALLLFWYLLRRRLIGVWRWIINT